MFDQIENVILPSQWIKAAINGDIIRADEPFLLRQVQPNSLDLRIGHIAHRVNCSFLPGKMGIENKLKTFNWYDVDIKETGTILERNHVYLFPLQEKLTLPRDIAGVANPKSTTGRLDVFTRLVSSTGVAFDEVEAGYQGPLYLEVVPRSFAIVVRPGDCLAQIRFQKGNPRLSDAETKAVLDSDEIVLTANMQPLRGSDLRIADGIFLSVLLSDDADGTIGYRARKNQAPIDLRKKTTIRHYWERIYFRSGPVILEPDEFYIFASRELVRLPPAYCAEMVPFDASSGELRTHYAGFFDSGFGYSPDMTATMTAGAIVLEIRNRDVPFLIEENHPLFRFILLRNAAVPDMLYGAGGVGSSYQHQRLRLSKQFLMSEDAATPPGQMLLEI